jgi:hypothetical protein
MIQNQDKIEKLREQDASELDYLKQMLKDLKENTENMDYELIRLGKDRDRKKKNLKYQCEETEVDIDIVKKSEGEKKTELCLAKRELQQVKDRNDVQTKKLEDDLKFCQIEMKKAKFVYENYEGGVVRLRNEVEGKQDKSSKMGFLQIPGAAKGMKSSRSRSRSKWNKSSDDKPQPFQRIANRAHNISKENDNNASNINILAQNEEKIVNKKTTKGKCTQLIKKSSNSKHKLRIKRPKSGKKARI